MAKTSKSRPPRLVPDRPFPPYAYIPGRTAHPTRDPDGHSYAATLEVPDPPGPAAWRDCRDYLYGIDLFNHGFFWEAHEAWEGLWVACGRHGPTATYLQALINLAAAGFKARWGNARGMKANAETAHRLFRAVERDPGVTPRRYMGLDVRMLADHAKEISLQSASTASGSETSPTFDLVLRPD
ncbi:MAG: DUF309 domain-containing protein [Rhodospirillales bacterium]|nr:DUF309 domain-containing protein [Rhodospirillales bacterium]